MASGQTRPLTWLCTYGSCPLRKKSLFSLPFFCQWFVVPTQFCLQFTSLLRCSPLVTPGETLLVVSPSVCHSAREEHGSICFSRVPSRSIPRNCTNMIITGVLEPLSPWQWLFLPPSCWYLSAKLTTLEVDFQAQQVPGTTCSHLVCGFAINMRCLLFTGLTISEWTDKSPLGTHMERLAPSKRQRHPHTILELDRVTVQLQQAGALLGPLLFGSLQACKENRISWN